MDPHLFTKEPRMVTWKFANLLLTMLQADKNPETNRGFTPLYIAAQQGHFHIFKFIIDNVNDKNPTNNMGFTCIHISHGCFKGSL